MVRANKMASDDQGYLSSLSKRYSHLNRYEPYCSLKGRFHCGLLWTLLLPLLESYQGNIFLWFVVNLTTPTLGILPREDVSVVRYEAYYSHSWNLTKGRFFYGSLWTLLFLDLGVLTQEGGSLRTLLIPTLAFLPKGDVHLEPYCSRPYLIRQGRGFLSLTSSLPYRGKGGF